MGPRGGFHFLHLIGGMICLALFFAVLLGLLFLALRIARKKGLLPKRPFGPGHHGPGPRGPRHEPGAPPHGPGPHEALRILDERLARSEIEIDDYQARRDALTGNRFPPFQQPPHSPHTPPGPDGPPMPPVADHPTAPPHPAGPDTDAPRPPQSPV
ncbi:hypothetical protein [Micropruina sonneratiae]|uniref:hypothetical protein n=1 Tax=Micropruina sonneratiae TaxID=2986940 RepID=UPI002227D5EA|nr:hypothetical protein [Micropruina sp. KQZ13P-5]MCW3156420.1 hypothetical protein [Micropruina sp. KQZ13P-5]